MKQGSVNWCAEYPTMEQLRAWLRENKGIETRKDAEAWVRKNVPLETKFQKAIFDHLNDLRKEGRIRCAFKKDEAGIYQRSGWPDVMAVIDGRYVGFEVKRPYVGEPSPLQLETINEIRQAGGIAEVVSFAFEVNEILEENGLLKGG